MWFNSINATGLGPAMSTVLRMPNPHMPPAIPFCHGIPFRYGHGMHAGGNDFFLFVISLPISSL
jgi:hypothetical protein